MSGSGASAATGALIGHTSSGCYPRQQ